MEHWTPRNRDDALDNGFELNNHRHDNHHHQISKGGNDDGLASFNWMEKIQVDFNLSDLAGMEEILDDNTDDLDKLLAQEVVVRDINNEVHDDIVNGLNVEQSKVELDGNLSLEDQDSESDIDKLLSMNIVEVDDADRLQLQYSMEGLNSDLMQEFAKGFLAQQDNKTVQQQCISDTSHNLLDRLSAGGAHVPGGQLLMSHHQQTVMMMSNHRQEYELQQQAQIMQQQTKMEQNVVVTGGEGALTSAKVSQLASMGPEDLEREKLKLLHRLQEIKRNSMNYMYQHENSQQVCFAASGVPLTGVDSAMRNSRRGESVEFPPNTFLGDQHKIGVVESSQASILTQENPNTHAAASILDIAPMDFGGSWNPFLREAAGGGNPLVGVMNKTSSNRNMIRKSCSGTNLQSTGVSLNRLSGQNLADMLSSESSRASYRNASWGSSGIASQRRTGVSAFTSSVILQRHASDGNLLTGAATVSASLAKKRNRVGSVSRENSLYNMLKNKQGPHKPLTSMDRQFSHSRLSKSGSRGSLSKNDSFGALLPTKRGGGRMAPKYKIGASTSVPQLMALDSPNQIGLGANAMWKTTSTCGVID
jgi:hypothetical protein